MDREVGSDRRRSTHSQRAPSGECRLVERGSTGLAWKRMEFFVVWTSLMFDKTRQSNEKTEFGEGNRSRFNEIGRAHRSVWFRLINKRGQTIVKQLGNRRVGFGWKVRVYLYKERFSVPLIKIYELVLLRELFGKLDGVASCCEKYLDSRWVWMKNESLSLQGTFPCASG